VSLLWHKTEDIGFIKQTFMNQKLHSPVDESDLKKRNATPPRDLNQ